MQFFHVRKRTQTIRVAIVQELSRNYRCEKLIINYRKPRPEPNAVKIVCTGSQLLYGVPPGLHKLLKATR
jgi:hypothetical protein